MEIESEDGSIKKAYFIKTPKGDVELRCCILCTKGTLDGPHLRCSRGKTFVNCTIKTLLDNAYECEHYTPRPVTDRQNFDNMMRSIRRLGGITYNDIKDRTAQL
jgi:hypothetical protein